jgi:hypothetical protein
MQLVIEWDYDESDCEDCGPSFSTGASATLGGEVVFNKPANAGCLSLVYVTREEVLEAVLKKLGVEIIDNY